MISLGALNPSAFFLGQFPVKEMWLGTQKVWPSLPYDAEVEYLESTGTQWIDTGYASTFKDEVLSARIKKTENSSSTSLWAIFASWGADNTERMQLYSETGRIGENYVTWPYLAIPADGVVQVVADIPNLRFVINGTQYASAGMTKPILAVPVSIFARTVGGSVGGFGSFKLYNFSISRNGVFVRDFTPVRFTNELGQSEGAMYDKVSKQLFRNKGTGNFTIGPDKV